MVIQLAEFSIQLTTLILRRHLISALGRFFVFATFCCGVIAAHEHHFLMHSRFIARKLSLESFHAHRDNARMDSTSVSISAVADFPTKV